MKYRVPLAAAGAFFFTLSLAAAGLETQFADPPLEARPRVYWLWLHSRFSKSRITFEMEEMKKKGIGGMIHWDPGAGPSRYGTRADDLPAGADWMSPEWRDAMRHALTEAGRMGLEVSLTLSPGPNCGGPHVSPDWSAQKVVWSVVSVIGPRRYSEVLPLPDALPRGKDGKPLHYRDLAVFAGETYRLGHTRSKSEVSVWSPIRDLSDIPLGNPWTNISSHIDASGRLIWDVPAGIYNIVRFGYSATGQPADYWRPTNRGLFADHMDAAAVERNFRETLRDLFGDRPLPASLKYIHCDSYEVYSADWTPRLVDEFRKRRGYDPVPFLPVLLGGNIQSRAVTARFLADLEKTRSDVFVDNHYQRLLDLTHERGIGFHSESGGPHICAIEALKALGRNDIPMGEFWTESGTHRVEWDERMYVKQAASAAHIYGKRFAAMEAFTSVGPHWEEDPWKLKPSGDQAFLDGANRMVLHTLTHSPEQFGKPGIEYFAGSHFNPNITWWEQARAWTDYLSRCQLMLSEGLFVADVLYYYGDHAPNFVPAKHLDPSLGPGYDYDVTNGEVILTRMAVRDGRLALPDGMSYRLLVLPEQKAITLEVLRKIAELVKAGATVVGPPPSESTGLTGYPDYPARDREVQALAREMWGDADGVKVKEHRYGKGRVIWGRTLREVLQGAGVGPDFAVAAGRPDAQVEAVHRTTPDAEIYFVVNKSNRPEDVECSFRVAGKAPELWAPDTGARRPQALYRAEAGRTTLPLRLDPHGSVFVVFRGAPPATHVVSVEPPAEVLAGPGAEVRVRATAAGRYTLRSAGGQSAAVELAAPPTSLTLAGPWTVRFAPGWGAPESAAFSELVSWSRRTEPGIRHFSGTAAYETRFDVPEGLLAAGVHTALDLGGVANLAEVRVNGRDLGILWKPPFRADVTGLLRARGNRLEVKVTNLWPNRIIGDESLPPEKRFTRSNMHKFTAASPLLPSGLLGPVRITTAREQAVPFR